MLLTLLENKGVGEDMLRSLAELSPDGRALIIDLIRSVARREKRS